MCIVCNVFQVLTNPFQSDYGVDESKVSRINYKHSRYAHSAVTLQPNGSYQHQVLPEINSVNQSSIIPCSIISSVKQDDGLELNEASEQDQEGNCSPFL